MDDSVKAIEVSRKDATPEETKKMLSELKTLIEKNAEISKAINEEPRRVLTKTYIEGNANTLKGLIGNIIGSYAFDTKGAATNREIAVTIMIEDINIKR